MPSPTHSHVYVCSVVYICKYCVCPHVPYGLLDFEIKLYKVRNKCYTTVTQDTTKQVESKESVFVNENSQFLKDQMKYYC